MAVTYDTRPVSIPNVFFWNLNLNSNFMNEVCGILKCLKYLLCPSFRLLIRFTWSWMRIAYTKAVQAYCRLYRYVSFLFFIVFRPFKSIQCNCRVSRNRHRMVERSSSQVQWMLLTSAGQKRRSPIPCDPIQSNQRTNFSTISKYRWSE